MSSSQSEGEFLHHEVDARIILEAVQVVGVSHEPHQEAAERYVRRSGGEHRQWIEKREHRAEKARDKEERIRDGERERVFVSK